VSCCRCADPGCPQHKGISRCAEEACVTLFRIDMDDETGTAFCGNCGADAIESGLFLPDIPEDESEEQESL
jgi:hypothetical protein